ncbi:MAG: hypothetical protein JWP91_1616 [Fibrobacteres bacterium]|nr:hypothetical protein [Fibrobacterota bacterium]
MNTVFYDPKQTEDQRRKLIYHGQIMVLAPTPGSLELCAFAKQLLFEGFGGLDPQVAHETMQVEKYVEILAAVKPKFIHHPESKRLLRAIARETGHDLEKTYLDTPRMRSAAPHDYLRYGIAYAFHPHRDTWYSAPFQQVNWWMPVFDFESGNAMAFHPKYWDTPVRNGSRKYNYQDWNEGPRQNASAHIKSDTREQPKPEEEVELDPQLRIVCPVGSMIQFSGAQLHSTVPNRTGTTRFSIDFRTVNLDDVRSGRGAHNIDSECTGTAMVDYMRGSDMAPMPEEVLIKHMAPGHFGKIKAT